MTAVRQTSVPGTLDRGALLWDNASGLWVNEAIDSRSVAAGYALVLSGAGSPASVVTAPIGTLYVRTDGGTSTTLYVKESGTGNTGWVAK